jgi:hypothetical protein
LNLVLQAVLLTQARFARRSEEVEEQMQMQPKRPKGFWAPEVQRLAAATFRGAPLALRVGYRWLALMN